MLTRLGSFTLAGAILASIVVAAPADATVDPSLRPSAAAATRPPISLPFVASPAAGARVVFFVHAGLRNKSDLAKLVRLQSTPGTKLYHHWLTPQQFATAFAPTRSTIDAIVAALHGRGLSVEKRGTQYLKVAGSRRAYEAAFGTQLGIVRDGGTLRIAERRPPSIPSDLRALGASVFGLEAAPQPRQHSRIVPLARNGAYGPYWFDDLKEAYGYPSYAANDGANVNIATVGYSDFSDTDTQLYFAHEKLGSATRPLGPRPNVITKAIAARSRSIRATVVQ